MEEKVNGTELGQPEPTRETLLSEEEATIPAADDDSAFIEVKFNKETKKLSIEEATALAQKGMKLEQLYPELERLKGLSKREGLSLTDFIRRLEREKSEQRLAELTEKCGGDTELAEKLFKLEGEPIPDEMEEFKPLFPELTYEQLPEEVKTAAENKGTGLLLEYLVYEHRRRLAADEEVARQKMSESASLGSLSSANSRSPAQTEFLKGVWSR